MAAGWKTRGTGPHETRSEKKGFKREKTEGNERKKTHRIWLLTKIIIVIKFRNQLIVKCFCKIPYKHDKRSKN